MRTSDALSPLAAAWRRVALAVGLASPSLLAVSFSPSSTMLNQLLAFASWGAVLMSGELCLPGRPWRDAWLPGLALLGLGGGALVSWGLLGLPGSMALSALLMLAAAATVLLAATGDDEGLAGLGGVFWVGLLVAGGLSALIALIQVFWPAWADGNFIARSGLPGRAVGNVRQPNHLSTLLLWALIALVPLAQCGRVLAWRLPRAALAGLGALLMLAVVLTASRTGVLGVLMLAAWGLLDKRLARPLRAALLAAPVVYLVFWLGMAAWSHHTQAAFGGEARLSEGDLSASRFGIWANAWALVLAQPWTGVGLGNFNFAWTLTAFPGRPVAFFDHTHNLPLQLAVELGLPAAVLLMGLLLGGLVLAWRRSLAQPAEEGGVVGRSALMIVLLAGVHSLLEYPLWYAYFLLPTAWAMGVALRQPGGASKTAAVALADTGVRLAGALMLVGTILALQDYRQVVVIYQPGANAGPLADRVAQGQRSPLFAHHADYAAATLADPPEQAGAALAHTTHSLLDSRLMIAWAQALANTGHVDEARYLAARLREFRNPGAAEFFAPCEEIEPGEAQPFQCQPPQSSALGWRDFLGTP